MDAVGKGHVEAAEVLARFATQLRYEDLPAEVRQRTKWNILDTLGIIVAASSVAEGCRELVGIITDGGGKAESTLLGFGGKVPAWMAAFGNGAMARALCYDDAHDDAATHPSSISVPVALATAERVGGVSGSDFITAVALGTEIVCRMGLAVCGSAQGWAGDWFLATVQGIFAGAAACGRLLGLDAGNMQHAFGIALCSSAGTMEALNPDSLATIGSLMPGFTAKASVLSALMAERGIGGPRNSLEGKAGLFPIYFRGRYDREILLGGLGQRFRCGEISVKPWPAVRNYHGYIEATLGLVRDHDIADGDIERIVASTTTPAERFQRQPSSPSAAVRSLPYLLAIAAVKRRIRIADIVPEALKDVATQALARRVTAQHDERFGPASRMGSGKVEIVLRDGRSYSRELAVAYGHPDHPISWDDLTGKFRECASYSEKPIPRQHVEQVINMVDRLEEVRDVAEVVRLLA